MKILNFLLVFNIMTVHCDNACDGTFKTFLDCISDSTGDPITGRQLETELDQDFITLTSKCYDTAEAISNTKCLLGRQELDIDLYGEEGPLRGCTLCQKIARNIRNTFFEADESVRKCLRQKFTTAIVEELQPCIQQQLGDNSFIVPPPPDFDRSTKNYLDIVEKGMSHRVMAYNRLQVCRYRFPQRAQNSESCLKNTAGLYKEHCNLVQSCKGKSVQPNCSGRFDIVKSATCKCMDLKRNEWHEKLDKIRDAIFNSDSASVCSSGVKNAVGVWRNKLEDAMKICLANVETDLPQIPMDKLIDLGCLRAQAVKESDDGKRQLTTGFRMVRNLLDALNDRITNFCEANC